MANLHFLDKRDENGSFIGLSAYELTQSVANDGLEIIKESNIYDILILNLPKTYIDLLFTKIIFESFIEIANQIVIYNYDKQLNDKVKDDYISIKHFPNEHLLRKIWPQQDIKYNIPIYQK